MKGPSPLYCSCCSTTTFPSTQTHTHTASPNSLPFSLRISSIHDTHTHTHLYYISFFSLCVSHVRCGAEAYVCAYPKLEHIRKTTLHNWDVRIKCVRIRTNSFHTHTFIRCSSHFYIQKQQQNTRRNHFFFLFLLMGWIFFSSN